MSSALKRHLKAAAFHVVPRLIRRGPTTRRRVALTFDDGPDDMTGEYLDVLDEIGARATFFLCGDQAVVRTKEVREYVRRGHQVASHGFNHRRWTTMRGAELQDQLDRTHRALGPLPEVRRWVRPPYGALSPLVLARLVRRGDVIALWSLDSLDHQRNSPPEAVAERCSPSHVHPGEVILLHEGQRWTLDALPIIGRQLKDAGYELVTMAELFDDGTL